MGRDHYQYLPLTETLMDTPRTNAARYEVKKRIRHTLLNGNEIWRTVDSNLRTSIFQTIDGPRDQTRQFDQDDIDEAREFRNALIDWLAFLYAGIQETDNIFLAVPYESGPRYEDEAPAVHFDFEKMLLEAISRAEYERGNPVSMTDSDVTIDIQHQKPVDTDEVLQQFKERRPLPPMKILHLVREGEIGQEAVEKYYQEIGTSR